MGGYACLKELIDHFVSAMALGSLGAIDKADISEDQREELRQAATKIDLEYLRQYIDLFAKYGVIIPIKISTLLLEKIMEVPGEPTG